MNNGMLCDSHSQCRGARECSCFGWCEGDDNCPEKAIPGSKSANRNDNRKGLLGIFEHIVFNCTAEQNKTHQDAVDEFLRHEDFVTDHVMDPPEVFAPLFYALLEDFEKRWNCYGKREWATEKNDEELR